MFLESLHDALQLLFALFETQFHLLYDLLLGVFAEFAACLDHFIHVLLLHTPAETRQKTYLPNKLYNI